MAKQPKPEQPANAENSIAQTGQTLSVTTPASDAEAAIAAALEDGKSPGGQIMVVGPKGGRWRAGRHFGPEPTIIDVADLTEEEGKALINDPKLVVGPAFPAALS